MQAGRIGHNCGFSPRRRVAGFERANLPRIDHETHVPTVESQTRPHPRLPGSHALARRPGGHQRPARQRPQASGGLSLAGPAEPVLHKLKTRAQIEAALQSEVVARSEHFVLHRQRLRASIDPQPVELAPSKTTSGSGGKPARQPSGSAPAETAFGVLVPKRWAARAVTRNMIKRQARAVAETTLAHHEEGAVFLLRLRRAWPPQQFKAATSPAWAAQVRQQLMSMFSALEHRSS